MKKSKGKLQKLKDKAVIEFRSLKSLTRPIKHDDKEEYLDSLPAKNLQRKLNALQKKKNMEL